MSYQPRPDTLAFRALAHMELLHPGSEISNSMLANQLNVSGPELIAALKSAREAGHVFSRQKGGHIRSPLFWSLVDHAARSNGAHLQPMLLQAPRKNIPPSDSSTEAAQVERQTVGEGGHAEGRLTLRQEIAARAGLSGNGVNIDAGHNKGPKGLAGAACRLETAKETTQAAGAHNAGGDDAKHEVGPASPGGLTPNDRQAELLERALGEPRVRITLSIDCYTLHQAERITRFVASSMSEAT